MKLILKNILFIFCLILMGCDKDALMPDDSELPGAMDIEGSKTTEKSLKTTGEVLVTYLANPGGHHDNNENSQDPSEEKIRFAQVIFDAQEAGINNAAKGELSIIIKNKNGVIKREFKASVYDVAVEPLQMNAWFLATIETDIRSDEGHSGEEEHDESTNSDMGQGNGQSNDENHDSEEHDDESHEGGCNSDDADHGHKSRVGDTIEVRVHDGGSPGTNGDLIKWKWHVSNSSHATSENHHTNWEEMCNKEIIEGNLVVHIK